MFLSAKNRRLQVARVYIHTIRLYGDKHNVHIVPVQSRSSPLYGYPVDWRDSVLLAPRYPVDWRDSVVLAPQVLWGLAGLSPFGYQVPCGLAGLSPFGP